MIILFKSFLASVSLIAVGATLTPGANWRKAMCKKGKQKYRHNLQLPSPGQQGQLSITLTFTYPLPLNGLS